MRSNLIYAVVCVAGLSFNANAAEPVARTITVSGFASTTSVPDHARITVGVETADKATVKAVDANSVLMARVVEAIKAVGIPEKALQTSRFSIEAQHPMQKDGYSQDLTVTLGYAVSNMLVVEVDDVSRVPQIIDAAVRAGANSSNSVIFDKKNSQELSEKMLAAAIKDARHKAEIAAAADGAKAGKPISIQVGSNDAQFVLGANQNSAMSYRIAPAPVMPGQVDIIGVVTVVYALE